MLNVHPSLLPRWRGAAPIERALMAGDTVTGVTIFQITAGLDSGPIALLRHEPIRPDDTAGTLAARLAPLGAHLLVEALDGHEAGALELTEQPEEGVTYADKIDPAERRLDPGRPAEELERVVRALTPAIGAYLELEGGERLGVSAARAVSRPRFRQASSPADEDAPAAGTGEGGARAARGEARRETSDASARRTCAVTSAGSRRAADCERDACAPLRLHGPAEGVRGGAYADRAFRAEADRAALDGRDRAFAMRLAYGTVQMKGTLDHVARDARAAAAGEARPAGAGGSAPRSL